MGYSIFSQTHIQTLGQSLYIVFSIFSMMHDSWWITICIYESNSQPGSQFRGGISLLFKFSRESQLDPMEITSCWEFISTNITNVTARRQDVLRRLPAGTGSLQRSSEGLANVTAPWFRCIASVPPVKPQLESSWLLALFQWTCQFSGPHLCKHLEQTFSTDVSYSPFMWLKLAGEEIRVLDLGCGFLSMLPLLLEQLVPAGVASMMIHDHGRYTRWCPPVVKRWFIFFL